MGFNEVIDAIKAEPTWAIVAGVVLLAAIMVVRRPEKKVAGVSKGIASLVLFVAAFLVLMQSGLLVGVGVSPFDSDDDANTPFSVTTTTTSNTPTGGISLPDCVGIEDTTVTLSAEDAYTSASTGGTHRYKLNGGPALTISDAGTLTASPGDQLQILWGNATSVSYLGDVTTTTVKCAGTHTISKKLYQNGTVTIRVFNEEGNLISDPENETLTNGDIVNLKIEMQGQFQRGLPWGGVIIAEYNKSTIDDVVIDVGGQETSAPSIYAITLAAESSTKAYTVPPMLSNALLTGTVVVDADDSNDPAGGSDDIILTFYPNDYFINEDTGGSYDGPSIEDEDDVQTFAQTNTFTLCID
jgi:hypothetical protein